MTKASSEEAQRTHSHVLPLLLQQRDQEIDRQHDVRHDLVLLHVDVTDGDSQTQDLSELKFDGRSDFVDFLGKIVTVRNGSGELSGYRCGVEEGMSNESETPQRPGTCVGGTDLASVSMLTFGQTGTQQPGNLLDQRLGSQESVVLLGELLDELLVLVEPDKWGRDE